mmetsp:Transcript_78002/g.135180  ORF Transcript_78002/g.135180 Transcript_78002/m.135180 type:complete len:475 (-) Transcript_78002:37-1461(-)
MAESGNQKKGGMSYKRVVCVILGSLALAYCLTQLFPAGEQVINITPTLAPSKDARPRSPWVRNFQIRATPPPQPHVDLVITSHCDSIDWIKDIDPKLASVLTVVVLHKVNDKDMEKPDCNPPKPKTPINVMYIHLPNAGRDGGSQFTYITKTYHALATYTMFMQAGYHWYIGNWLSEAHGFSTNAAAVNELVPMVLQFKPRFVPVAPHIAGDPILFFDRMTNEDKEAQDESKSPKVKGFDAGPIDMFNQARDMLGILFGMRPCDQQEEILYAPGMQYIVSRDLILARPKIIWEGLEDMSLNCDYATYAIERVSFFIFNSSKVAVPPDTWRLPKTCEPTTKHFMLPELNPYYTRDYWSKRWGCDSLTPFLKERESTSPMAKAAVDLSKKKRSICSWSILYDVWMVAEQRTENGDCLEICCKDPTCIGMQWQSGQASQCYIFTEKPKELDENQDKLVPMDSFDDSKPSTWSFFVKG